MFEYSLVKSKDLGYFVAFAIPFVLLVLSNEYRGDNISRLTVETGIYPFDEFDTLVQHEFMVYVWQKRLRNLWYRMFKKNKHQYGFHKTSNNEYFPIVSTLWFQIMIQFPSMNTLQKFACRLSNRTWLYLNHTRIFDIEDLQALKNFTAKMHGYHRSIMQLMYCNKSAVMLHGSEAFIAYKNLSYMKAPVFLGKDIIHENIYGYAFSRKMPASVHLRQNYVFQAGICRFWNKYIDCVLELRANNRFRIHLNKKYSFGRESGTFQNQSLVAGCYYVF